MILFYRIRVLPFGRQYSKEAVRINTLEFKLQFTEDIGNFVRLWTENYPKALVSIEAWDNDSD